MKQHSDKKETCPFEKCGKTLLLSFLVIVVSITFAVSVLFRCGLGESKIKGNNGKDAVSDLKTLEQILQICAALCIFICRLRDDLVL
jgi:hypothetical protein